MAVLKLTKTVVEGLPFASNGQMLYCDSELPGFWLLVGKTSKTYLAKGRVNRKDIRYSIGKHGVFTTEEARRDARLLLADMARGIDPNAIKKEKARKRLTFGEAFEKFIEIKQDLSIRTVADYTVAVIEDVIAEQVKELRAEGLSQRDIAAQLGISAATVNRTLKKLDPLPPPKQDEIEF